MARLSKSYEKVVVVWHQVVGRTGIKFHRVVHPKFVQSVLESVEGWCIHDFTRETIPGVHDRVCEEILKLGCFTSDPVQLETVGSGLAVALEVK